MSINEQFNFIRDSFFDNVSNFFKVLASFFGYPENTGMPTIRDLSGEAFSRAVFFDNLPIRKTFWPPPQKPTTWFQMIFGTYPKVDPVPKYIYENNEEGFYNFYIENYRNIYFLPDWLSEFIQVKFNVCLDLTNIEIFREVLFLVLVSYYQVVILRIALSWFIFINPYTVPWCYLAAVVDWTEDALQGFVPAFLGVNLTGNLFLGILGLITDNLNHLVFTMPFLPSEGEETKLFIDQQMKDVLVFHYLPILWYRYPIPNELREFWYTERPDILNYLQTAYSNFNIQFLPDNILN